MSFKLDYEKRLLKELVDLPPKHFKQVALKVLSLTQDPLPSDSKQLMGYDDLRRADSGEYRIVYAVRADIVTIIFIGKRNDDEVYRHLDRKLR